MIRTSPATYYRAAGAFLAAAVFTVSTHRASAQAIDLFGGTGTPASLGVTGLVALPTSASGAFGPGYNGTVNLTLGAVNTLSESFATSGLSNTFTIAETGVATLAGTTSAFKTFTGTSLTPGATYALTLTRTAGFTVGLLGSVNIVLTNGSTTVLNTSTGQGLAGIADVLGLFGSANTETLNFTVPAGATGNLAATITSSETAGVAGGSYTFATATITQVPEPRTTWATLLGVGGLAVLRFRRRLRTAF